MSHYFAFLFSTAAHSHRNLCRENSIHQEKKRILKLTPSTVNSGDSDARGQFKFSIFSEEMKLFGHRTQKEDVEKRIEWRKQLNPHKFPFAIYNHVQDLPSYKDAVRALVYRRNSDIVKKRYPCLPSIVIASTPCDPAELESVERMVALECHFSVNPLSSLWLLSCFIHDSHSSCPQMFPSCKTVFFMDIGQYIHQNQPQWKTFYEDRAMTGEEVRELERLLKQKDDVHASPAGGYDKLQELLQKRQQQSHFAVDFVKSVLNKDKHEAAITSLSRADSVVLLDHTSKSRETTKQPGDGGNEKLFSSICQMMSALSFCCDSGAFLHRTDRNRLTRIFIVADTSAKYQKQYIEAFRTGACLLMARGDGAAMMRALKCDRTRKDRGMKHSLPTFCLFYKSVELTFRSIELFFRYFLNHMSCVKRIRVDSVELKYSPHSHKNIAERIHRLQTEFKRILEETKLFHLEGTGSDSLVLDFNHLGLMFECMLLLQQECMHHDAKPDVKEMWKIFLSAARSKYNFQSERQPMDLSTIDSAVKHFAYILQSFDYSWYEAFEPENPTEEFFSLVDQIAEIVESTKKVFIIPQLSASSLSTEISRISIRSIVSGNHSASVRLYGETALMYAACLGQTKHVGELLAGCSLSQILSCSEHPQAHGLDALFMSLFFGHVDVAKEIVKCTLEFSEDLAQIDRHPFCVHNELGCTTFMLACRYGDADLLDNLFQLLDVCRISRTLRKSVRHEDLEQNRREECLRTDRNKANALHHAIIAANFEAVDWLKKKRSNQHWQNLKECHQFNLVQEKEGKDFGRDSVFGSGRVEKRLAAKMLSPTFALLHKAHRNCVVANDVKAFLQEAIRSDYCLMYESLKRVDLLLLGRCDLDASVPKPLQEYELAVMLWGICNRHHASKLANARHSVARLDSHVNVGDPILQPTGDFEMALHLMRKCAADRCSHVDECAASVEDTSDPETNVRKQIAQKLTEFSESEWTSPWFKVQPLL